MMRTTGDVYLWPAAAERKLRMAYQAGLPAYLYGVTGVGKTSLIRHFLEKKEYFYVSALNTTPDDLESEKITAPVIVEYSRAVTPQIRQAGNRLSGLAETAYASLLA